MDKEELKRYAKAQKEKYLAGDLALGIKRMQDIDRILLKDERDIFGENTLTDEEIEAKNQSTEYLRPEDYESFQRLYDPDHMSGHPMITCGINIEEACERFRRNETETLVYIAIGENNQILGYVSEAGNTSHIGGEVVQTASRRLITEFPEVQEVIILHNHPHVVAAVASPMDGRIAMQARIAFDFFGIRLIDDCVVTEVDFYSRKRDESDNKGSNRVYTNILPEDLRQELRRVNPNLESVLH